MRTRIGRAGHGEGIGGRRRVAGVRAVWKVCAAVAVLVGVVPAGASDAKADEPARRVPGNWLAKVRMDHPRMFFNKATWPQVKAYALTHEKGYTERMKRIVASLPASPDRRRMERGSNPLYGPYAQMCAFVWRLEGDAEALAKAKTYLLEAVRFYNRRSSARQAVNWYSASRVCAMTAYDWIHDELSAGERREVGLGLLQHYKECLSGQRFPRQNRSDHTTGFYGPTNMAWYVGLALHKDGINDAEALRLLKQGYAEHMTLLAYRGAASGDDGGAGSLAVGYAFGMYPWAEFNFMHTYASATGLAMEDHFDHMSLMANWVFWNRLPGNMRWGLADSVPAGTFSDGFLEMHFLQAAHFYAARFPERARFALWVRENILSRQEHDNYWWPLAPLMLTRCGELPGPAGPDASWPLARNFEKMGVVFMRSDWTEAAACAALVAGGDIKQHRHYDQGHFTIYRKGFLAIDSGDYGPREANEHLKEYLYRTVAHNSLLIHAPAAADKKPKVWGGTPATFDGGQFQQAGRQIAFETSPAYSYAATDMTGCYAPEKCRGAARQFVFVHPGTFVICDRVVTTRPEFRKVWLMHSVNEPQMEPGGRTFRVEHGEGALIGCTLLPVNANVTTVGGPGKEYWSDGKNRAQVGAHKELAGAWRVEVSPKARRATDVFLHVLRVGDRSMKEMGTVDLVKDRRRVGARFTTAKGDTATVWFNVSGAVGGHVTIGGAVAIDRALTTRVAPQVGLATTARE